MSVASHSLCHCVVRVTAWSHSSLHLFPQLFVSVTSLSLLSLSLVGGFLCPLYLGCCDSRHRALAGIFQTAFLCLPRDFVCNLYFCFGIFIDAQILKICTLTVHAQACFLCFILFLIISLRMKKNPLFNKINGIKTVTPFTSKIYYCQQKIIKLL